jgi:glycosyltransferase involved in cell wall biosynthesis
MTSAAAMPLRVLFLTTSLPVGGAETLLENLVRQLDRKRFAPEIVCLKERGPLGEKLACEMRVYSHMLASKYDLRVLSRLWRIMRVPRADAVITVGAGDKMFWGRLAAKLAGVPVIASALHSTGWPDGVGRLNRLLTPITDAFVGVATDHGRHLVEIEGFPAHKVHVIFNGVDASRFRPQDSTATRASLGLPRDAPVVGILAALRPEKNHELFLLGAQRILAQRPSAQFLVVGDGPKRRELETLAEKLGVAQATHFLGTRGDVPQLLATCDLVALTSHNEAAPVSILEALSTGVPVVAANVGSVRETVLDGVTGQLFPAGDVDAFAAAALDLLRDPAERKRLGAAGRRLVEERWSLDAMVHGYEQLIEAIYESKKRTRAAAPSLPLPPGEGRGEGAPAWNVASQSASPSP